jgi:hypothetical protein
VCLAQNALFGLIFNNVRENLCSVLNSIGKEVFVHNYLVLVDLAPKSRGCAIEKINF